MQKLETFAAAKSRILSELKELGWTIASHLKVPYAVSPYVLPYGETIKVWFKPQALYSGGHSLKDSHSLCSDYRDVTGYQIQNWLHK